VKRAENIKRKTKSI